MKVDFTTRPEVLARLTYMSDGTPVALLGGKKRDAASDMELLKDWLRAMFLVTRAQSEPPALITDEAPHADQMVAERSRTADAGDPNPERGSVG